MDVFYGYSNGGANIDLSNISPLGKQNIKNIAEGGGIIGNTKSVNNVDPDANGNISLTSDNIPPGVVNKYVNNASLGDLDDVTLNNLTFSDVLFYDNFAFNPGQFTNRQLNTDFVPEPNVQFPQRRYFTDQRVTDHLLNLISNYGILYNNNGNLESLHGAQGTYIRAGTNQVPSFTQIRMNEVRDHSTMVRDENITIPANGITNMLQWLQNSNIFNELIIPNGLPANPFFWGVRGDADYGMWKIQNVSNQPITIERVNLIPSAVFIIFNFVRSLINNIMDDNINNGDVRVRINGINSQQVGGDAQIFNDQGDINSQLGKTRTFTSGNNITITQNNDTITISANGSNIDLQDLHNVLITNVQNKNLLAYDANSAKWTNQTIGLNDLDDTIITNAANLQVIKYNGIDWINEKIFLSDIDDINLAGPVNGDVLIYNNTAFENRQLTLSDITTPLTTNGDILYHNGTSVVKLARGTSGQVLSSTGTTIQWETKTSVSTLAGLTDVNLNALADQDFLRYDSTSSKWKNSTVTSDNITQGSVNLYASNTNLSNYLLSVLTASQDILIRNGAAISKLSIGSNNQILSVSGGALTWINQPTLTTTLSALTDVSILNVQNNQFLRYSTGNNKWTNQSITTDDIPEGPSGNFPYCTTTKFQTRLLEILTGSGDLLYRDNTANATRLPIGTANQYLRVSGTLLPEWANFPVITTTLDGLTDVTINTPLTGQVLYKSNGDWVNQSLAISDITNLQNSLNGKIDNTILTTQGDILYRDGTGLQRLPKGTNGQVLTSDNTSISWTTLPAGKQNLSELNDVTFAGLADQNYLRYNSTSQKWENIIVNTSIIPEGGNLYYTDTRVNNVLNSKYTGKGKIQVGIGADSYSEQAAPLAVGRVLVSDINNLLNPTGLSWSQLALNGSYFSNISPTAPTAGQVLAWNTGNNRYEPTNSLSFPLLAPNGTAANPSYSFVNAPNTGFYSIGLGRMNMVINGVEMIEFDGFNNPRSVRMRNRMIITNDLPDTSNLGSTIAVGSGNLRWSGGGLEEVGILAHGFSRRFAIQTNEVIRLLIDNTSTKVQRLDILNTFIEDFRIRINNIFNSFSFQNNAGTAEYLKIDTGNNRTTLPRRFVSSIIKNNATVLNTIVNLNNNYFSLNFGDATAFSITNNANATPTLSMVANTNEWQINNCVGIRLNININLSVQLDKNVAIVDFGLFDESNAAVEISQFHKTMRIDANYFGQYDIFGYYTPTVTTQRLSIKIRCSQGATVTPALYNMFINVSDTML